MKLLPITSLSTDQTWQLCALYQNEWWSKDRKIEDVKEMLEYSDFLFGYAEQNDNLVAFARVLTDRVFKAFLYDVIIAPDFRKTGLGRILLNDILNHPVIRMVKHIELYCLPELVPFYEQWGFSCNTGSIVFMRRAVAG